MDTKKINLGKICAQVAEGLLITYMALTKQSSATTIQGKSRAANLIYLATGKLWWNMKKNYFPVVRINGVVSGCQVSGGTSNDNLEVTAGTVNVNGTLVTVTADTSNAVVRGAASNYVVHALCVDAAGTLSVVAGTTHTALDLTGGYGGAGQKPLVATTLAVIAYCWTYGATGAPIAITEILAGESANIDYKIDPLRGGILLSEALAANHTGPVERGVYAQFYDLYSAGSVKQIGKVEEGTLDIQFTDPQELPQIDLMWKEYESIGTKGFSISIKKWRETDDYWIQKAIDPYDDKTLFKFYEDEDDTNYFLGYCIRTGTGQLTNKRGAPSETLTLRGTGELRRI